MEGKENYVLGNWKDIRFRFCRIGPEDRAFRRHKLLEKQLADQALSGCRTGGEMPVMRKMLRAILAEDILTRPLVVMVKRRNEHHRQDDRQQPGGKYASFQGHSGGKDKK